MQQHEQHDQLSRYWKVPGRRVYCETLGGWIAATARCHVYYRFFFSEAR